MIVLMPCRTVLRLLILLVLFLASGVGLACADEVLGITTGPKTGTYYAIGKDIAQVAAKSGITVDVKASEGSIDNIKRIDSTDNAAIEPTIGIVQSDVLGFLSRSKSPASMKIANNMRMIFPFYSEEVHVLARNEIKTFADLKGKRVAVGEEGSGNMLTAINLFAMMNVTPVESRKISSAQGVVAVLKGELDAVIFVGGKPVRLFKNLEDLTLPENQKYAPMLEHVHFLPLDDPRMLEEYKPAEITSADYKFVHDTVRTVSVQALLVSYEVSQQTVAGKKRCASLAAVTRVIRQQLPELRATGHAKWKEVNLDADTGVWKKDSCVASAVETAEKANLEKTGADKVGAEKAALTNIVEKNKN